MKKRDIYTREFVRTGVKHGYKGVEEYLIQVGK
jgi:hypothetical protein